MGHTNISIVDLKLLSFLTSWNYAYIFYAENNINNYNINNELSYSMV